MSPPDKRNGKEWMSQKTSHHPRTSEKPDEKKTVTGTASPSRKATGRERAKARVPQRNRGSLRSSNQERDSERRTPLAPKPRRAELTIKNEKWWYFAIRRQRISANCHPMTANEMKKTEGSTRSPMLKAAGSEFLGMMESPRRQFSLGASRIRGTNRTRLRV
jgi:hypothetical protein